MISVIEKWRPVKGYEGYYEVNDWGDIKSIDYHRSGKNKLLTPHKTKRGYYRISLHKDGIKEYKYVHRLVAEAFIENLYNLPQINHKDEVKTNNCVDNLEWCTNEYNMNYGTGQQRCKDKVCKKVLQYSLDSEFIREWESTLEVERQMGYDHSSLSRCCMGKQKKAYGYKWRYK